MSSSTAVRHIIWKEYRQQRVFWLVIALFAVFNQGLTVAVAVTTAQPTPVYALFAIALGMPILYALGSGAVIFAGEHEAETFDTLQAWPVTAGRWLWGKIGFASCSAMLMPLCLWLVAWALAGWQLPHGEQHAGLWFGSLLLLVEVFAWAVLYSLIMRRVLVAVVLAAATTIVTSLIAQPQLTWLARLGIQTLGVDLGVMLLLRESVVLAVIAVDICLGRKWLDEHPLFAPRQAGTRHRGTLVSGEGSLSARRSGVFGRLLWQNWRQSAVPILWILGCGSLLTLLVVVLIASAADLPRNVWGLPLIATPLVAAALGACVFGADQRQGQVRFLAERGVSPRWTWFSRQVISLFTLIAWTAFALVAVGIAVWLSHVMRHWIPSSASDPYVVVNAFTVQKESLTILFAVLGFAGLTYCVGQACSLFVRSGVIALFLGLLLGWLVCLWAGLMWIVQVPLWFSVVPIALVLLWSSWLRAPDWMSERTDWRARGKLIISLAGPLLAIGLAVIAYRRGEIPDVQAALPANLMPREATAAEIETANLYWQAWLAFEDNDSPADGEDASAGDDARGEAPHLPATASQEQREAKRQREEQAIQTFLRATRERARFPTSRQILGSEISSKEAMAQNAASYATSLASAVLDTCKRLEQEERLDEAWERYVAVLAFARQLDEHSDALMQARAESIEFQVFDRLPPWAIADGQTPERIRTAYAQLQSEHLGVFVTRQLAIADRFLLCQQMLQMQNKTMSTITAQEAFMLWWTSKLLPWEMTRARRLLNYSVDRELRLVRQAERELQSNGSLVNVHRNVFQADRRIERWMDTTPLSVAFRPIHGVVDAIGFRELRRRAVRLQLVLAAWRSEHGELPASLDQLVPGEITEVPRDPFSGQPFTYMPAGIAIQTTRKPVRAGSFARPEPGAIDTIAAHQPFLWSPGANLHYASRPLLLPANAPRPGDYHYLESYGGARNWRTIVEQEELWHAGWCFAVPTPAAAGAK